MLRHNDRLAAICCQGILGQAPSGHSAWLFIKGFLQRWPLLERLICNVLRVTIIITSTAI